MGVSVNSLQCAQVLRTQPRSGPVRFGTAPASKFLTVRNLLSPTPRRSYIGVSVNSLQCAQPLLRGRSAAVGDAPAAAPSVHRSASDWLSACPHAALLSTLRR